MGIDKVKLTKLELTKWANGNKPGDQGMSIQVQPTLILIVS